jgi:hypothetical protein
MPESPSDAIAVLRADNREIEVLLAKLRRSDVTGAEREVLIGDLDRALTIHMGLLEQIAFPAFREAGVYSSILDHAKSDQDAIRRLILDLRNAAQEERFFDTRVRKLAERVKCRELLDESDMFPDAEMAGVDMVKVGKRLHVRRSELTSGADRI